MHDIKEFICDEIKDVHLLPKERWILMSDNTRVTVKGIIDVLHKRHRNLTKHGNITATSPPLLFHYDTTFNVGKNFVSILTMRDPTKRRLGVKESKRHVFVEPILPIAVMVHEGKIREQHIAFFQVIDSQLDYLTNGAFSHEKRLWFVTMSSGMCGKEPKPFFVKHTCRETLKSFSENRSLDHEVKAILFFHNSIL